MFFTKPSSVGLAFLSMFVYHCQDFSHYCLITEIALEGCSQRNVSMASEIYFRLEACGGNAMYLPASHFCFYPEYISDIFQIRGRGDAFSARHIFVFSLNMFQIRSTCDAYGPPL